MCVCVGGGGGGEGGGFLFCFSSFFSWEVFRAVWLLFSVRARVCFLAYLYPGIMKRSVECATGYAARSKIPVPQIASTGRCVVC